jgi:precorrin-8X/cobalt-precorrin-8 methylmutase
MPELVERQTLLARYGLPPAEIERRSLALVEAQAGAALPADPVARKVAVMMLYATGEPALAPQIRVGGGAVEAGLAALAAGRPICTDVRMVAAAIEPTSTRLGIEVRCWIDDPATVRYARERNMTRAAAAVQLHIGELHDAVVVIGNAPTALLALLDEVDAGRVQPALIVGVPVGLVAAAESKDELLKRAVPYVTVLGTRGGSAIAAAAINAILRLAVGSSGG